ncbi:MAG TPA: sigma 54 modulation/S30EA ribosomal C-terminal domain-containing protein, partial [Dongiaceae bacterium]
PEKVQLADHYVLASTPESADEGAAEADEDGPPTVVAEMKAEILALTVSEAVMRLDLADRGALMFVNRAHGGLNMVYRRPDGNIGWVDPKGNRGA